MGNLQVSGTFFVCIEEIFNPRLVHQGTRHVGSEIRCQVLSIIVTDFNHHIRFTLKVSGTFQDVWKAFQSKGVSGGLREFQGLWGAPGGLKGVPGDPRSLKRIPGNLKGVSRHFSGSQGVPVIPGAFLVT